MGTEMDAMISTDYCENLADMNIISDSSVVRSLSSTVPF